ncbi:SigE family RNA polymerase sigma factor [Actinokineospora sp. PR83]|uniref:SigE family RNA polymerase sigma factor n=1 Tax=Actinokineospora sp. PR83 TaxID=2884908 RepID=UPI0027E1341B|nr:SigE family RNA polymerase sigma factor [Actinokineospora sp. PR83]MCG8917417.1 SigE family RNA polymerase sigma factor [Actinokineospora sp. PR83]
MRESFDQFVAERLDRLLRYATAMTCDRHLAQDIVQEVLLRAQRRWSRIGDMEASYLYVKKMVTNEYLSWRRRKAARDITATRAALEAASAPVGDFAHDYVERDAMRARIAALPRRQRAAIVLRYYEDCTTAQIAHVLGCTEGTARSHLSHALSTLRADTTATASEALR